MKISFTVLLLFSIYTMTTDATYQIEVGPYEVTDDETAEFERSDIAEDQEGVPLQYVLTIQRNGTPVAGTRLDTWSANADGLYSGIEGDGTGDQDFLRGWQVSNETGQITFTAIYPGAYLDRTTHVHFRIREFSEDGVNTTYDNTTQLFFPANITEQVMALDTYSTESWNTVNSNDRLYVADNEVVLTGNVDDGFIATYIIELPLTENDNPDNANDVPGSSGSGMPSQAPSGAALSRRNGCKRRLRAAGNSR